jgi:predicted kinase
MVNQMLVVFTGLPGTGKSSVAEVLGREFRIPVFAKDWLEAELLLSGLKPDAGNIQPGSIAYDLLTTLAGRQLALGQSAILDSVAGTESIRGTWRNLAAQYHAGWKVIECICSDEELHRQRLQSRRRGIPGWHELTWIDVEKVKGYYLPWYEEERLILDMARPLEENISKALAYLEETRPSTRRIAGCVS